MIRYICKPFKKLTVAELYAIMILRQEVFVVEQKCAYADADGLDPAGHHLMGFDKDHQLVAYSRLLPEGTRYESNPSIDRIIVSKALRGKGFGKELLEESAERLIDLFGEATIKLSAQVRLTGFYESTGFSRIGKKYKEDDVWHIGMIKAVS